MGNRQKYSEPAPIINWPTYSKQELDAFGDFLSLYRIDGKGAMQMNEARVAYGAMSRKFYHGGIIYSVLIETVSRYGGQKIYKFPTKYELFEHKLKAWETRQNRREFARDMQIKDLTPPPETNQLIPEEND